MIREKLLIALIFVLILALNINVVAQSSSAIIGKAAPSFRLKNINSPEDSYFSLSNYFQNDSASIVILSFFASWCKPCIKELKYLQALTDTLEYVKLVPVLIEKEFGAKQKNMIKLVGLNGLVVQDKYGILVRRYEVGNELPVSVFIDKFGIVRDITKGFTEKSKVHIKQIIKGITQ